MVSKNDISKFSIKQIFNSIINPAGDGINITTLTNNRHAQPVNAFSISDTNNTKVSYVVPANKQLFIEFLTLTSENGNQTVEWRSDGIVFFAQRVQNTNEPTKSDIMPQFNPLGPFAAGVTITAFKTAGTSSALWSALFLGYLEDV